MKTKQWVALIRRSFREGGVQVWRNKFLSGTTVFLGVLILFLLNVVFSAQFYAEYFLKRFEAQADFPVALRENYDAFEFDAMKNQLMEFNLTEEVLPPESYDDYTVPPRLLIHFGNIHEVGEVFGVLKNPRYDSVVGEWDTVMERDFRTIIDQLLRTRDGVDRASFWMTIIFTAGGLLLVLNTFRIVLFTRRDEVFIARFVGAEDSFISGPFLWEGALLGFVSSLLSIVFFLFFLREVDLPARPELFLYLWDRLFAWEVVGAALVGIVGAWWSVRRYLRGRWGQ